MTRKSDSGSNSSRSAANLKSLRQNIDKLDMQILKMVNERASLAHEIGKQKEANGAEIFVEHPGAYPLIEHERHTAGVLDLDVGDGVTCHAVCFTPGLG